MSDEPRPTRTRVLLVSGWAGSGKDAVATALGRYGYRRIAFADPLKRHVAAITGIPEAVFHSHTLKDRPFTGPPPLDYPTARTPRDVLLQHAVAARERDPDVYAREIATEIRDNPGLHHWVISDWRYRREYSFLRSALPPRENYELIRVRVSRPGIVPSIDHTEHDLDDEEMDHIVENDTDLTALRRDIVNSLVRRYGTSAYRPPPPPEDRYVP
jgi:hypothetical protein